MTNYPELSAENNSAKQDASAAQAVPADFLQICREELERGTLTSLPLKLEFAKRRGMSSVEEVHEWMMKTRQAFKDAVAKSNGAAQQPASAPADPVGYAWYDATTKAWALCKPEERDAISRKYDDEATLVAFVPLVVAQADAPKGEPPAGFMKCPITGRPFWGNLDHPKLGMVATYGGPFDTYTIPAIDGDGELRSERYDQDRGEWIEGGEPIGWFYEDQPPSAAPVDAAAIRNAALEEAAQKLDELHGMISGEAWDRYAEGCRDAYHVGAISVRALKTDQQEKKP